MSTRPIAQRARVLMDEVNGLLAHGNKKRLRLSDALNVLAKVEGLRNHSSATASPKPEATAVRDATTPAGAATAAAPPWATDPGYHMLKMMAASMRTREAAFKVSTTDPLDDQRRIYGHRRLETYRAYASAITAAFLRSPGRPLDLLAVSQDLGIDQDDYTTLAALRRLAEEEQELRAALEAADGPSLAHMAKIARHNIGTATLGELSENQFPFLLEELLTRRLRSNMDLFRAGPGVPILEVGYNVTATVPGRDSIAGFTGRVRLEGTWQAVPFHAANPSWAKMHERYTRTQGWIESLLDEDPTEWLMRPRADLTWQDLYDMATVDAELNEGVRGPAIERETGAPNLAKAFPLWAGIEIVDEAAKTFRLCFSNC